MRASRLFNSKYFFLDESGQLNLTVLQFYEDDLKTLFVDAFNSIITERKIIIAAYHDIIPALTDNAALENAAQSSQNECDVVLELMRQAVALVFLVLSLMLGQSIINGITAIYIEDLSL